MNRELVERAMQGDATAFEQLAGLSFEKLYGTARLMLDDDAACQDAVQETLVRAWRDLPRLREIDRYEAWLRRLLVNACRDEGRRQRRRKRETPLLPSHSPSVPDASAGMTARDELERAFRGLPSDQRAVIVLQHYHGLSLPEIATTLDLPLGTVKSRVHRAKEYLRAALEADAREPGASPEVTA